MQTPKEYTNNLKNGIVTETMLSDCIYSCNKRAKNWRDKEAQIRDYFKSHYYATDNYNYEERAMEKKMEYYEMKETMLELLKPVCIHREVSVKTFWLHETKTPWESTAVRTGDWDYSDWGGKVYEYRSEREKHYLYYKCGNHSFHTPIDSTEEYPDLPVIELEDGLTTHGADTDGLLSMQFVKKVLALVETGKYTFKRTEDKAVA